MGGFDLLFLHISRDIKGILYQGGWGWVVVLVGCFVHLLVNGTQVAASYIFLLPANNTQMILDYEIASRQVVVAILVTILGKYPHC